MEEAFISADEKNEGFIPIKQAKQVFDNLGLDGNSQAVEALLLFHYTQNSNASFDRINYRVSSYYYYR